MEREDEREEGIHRGWEVGEQERRKEGKKKEHVAKRIQYHPIYT